MLSRGEEWTSSTRVDPATDSERRRMRLIDKSKGMIFDGSTKRCMYRAIAIPRSDIDSQNRDGGMKVKPLIYLACTTIYDFFLFDVNIVAFYHLCHPRNLRVVFAAFVPQNVISERAGPKRFGLACAVLEGLRAELLHLHDTIIAIGNHHKDTTCRLKQP